MANASERMVNGIKTRVLHGKDYVEVHERVHQVYEQDRAFSIPFSEPVEIAGRWLWRSVIIVDGQQYIGCAEIKFDAPKNTPDGTNPFECAETSAIGRALAFAGFGSVEAIASKDEIMRGQPRTIEPVAERQVIESGNGHARTLSAPQVPELAMTALYTQGKTKAMWPDQRTFLVSCSAILGVPVGAENYQALTEAQRRLILEAIEQEQAPTAVGGCSLLSGERWNK